MKNYILGYSILAFAALGIAPTFLPSCATVKKRGTSDLKYAYIDSDALGGTPLGIFMAREAKIIKSGDEYLTICVESMGENFDRADLMVEAKASYFYWLYAAGRTEVYWRMKFDKRDDCLAAGLQYDVVLGLAAEEDKTVSGVRAALRYPRADCERLAESVSCSSAVVMGQGGAAAISYSTLSNAPEKWVGVEIISPASSVFNRGVDWVSFRDTVKNSGKIADADKKNLIAALNLAKNEDSIEVMTKLVKLLEASKLLDEKKTNLDEVIDRVSADKNFVKGDVRFKMSASWLHTALHEVGHQFGLMHPDNVRDEWKTGASSLTKEENGKHITDQAIMAYGLPYLYLTEDDAKGAEDVMDITEKFMKSRIP